MSADLKTVRRLSEAQQQRIKRENNERTEAMDLRDKLREEYDAGLDDVDGRYPVTEEERPCAN